MSQPKHIRYRGAKYVIADDVPSYSDMSLETLEEVMEDVLDELEDLEALWTSKSNERSEITRQLLKDIDADYYWQTPEERFGKEKAEEMRAQSDKLRMEIEALSEQIDLAGDKFDAIHKALEASKRRRR